MGPTIVKNQMQQWRGVVFSKCVVTVTMQRLIHLVGHRAPEVHLLHPPLPEFLRTGHLVVAKHHTDLEFHASRRGDLQ